MGCATRRTLIQCTGFSHCCEYVRVYCDKNCILRFSRANYVHNEQP